MTNEEKLTLLDMQEFIAWAIRKDMGFMWTLSNLAHDCRGLILEEPCFLPRSNGYNAIMEKVRWQEYHQ